ncbi:MAG: hypothetical protein IT212_07695 [Bacteroidia bacterium]|nr:hypothetical protein [Bacteroidia bacterium]
MALEDMVYMTPEHKYFNRETGEQLMAWSRFQELFFPSFDKKKMAAMCAGKGDYVGMTETEVIKKWEAHGTETANHGTDVHNALEHYSNTFTIKEEHKQFEPLVKSIQANYNGYNKVFSEERLWTKHGIAGTCDKVCYVTSHKDSPFDISDFKNFKNGLEYVPKEKAREKWCKFPIQHLPNCNFTKVAIQLSGYAFMKEEMSGRKCRKLTVIYIPLENKLEYVQVVVPYLRLEIIAMITEFKRMKAAGELPGLTSMAIPQKTLITEPRF